MNGVSTPLQIIVYCRAQAPGEAIAPAAELVLRRNHHLGGRGRGRRAEVRHEVGNRDVDLMADGGDDRDWGGDDRPGHALLVECPEILDRSASATDDDDI